MPAASRGCRSEEGERWEKEGHGEGRGGETCEVGWGWDRRTKGSRAHAYFVRLAVGVTVIALMKVFDDL